MLLRDQNEIVERLEALKALGVRVAVDDFGTGYAQGFLFRRPLPPERIEPLLEAGCVPLAESRHTQVA